jgi:hypothetical protein
MTLAFFSLNMFGKVDQGSFRFFLIRLIFIFILVVILGLASSLCRFLWYF